MAFGDVLDYFGSAYAKEKNGIITIGGIDMNKLRIDLKTIWQTDTVATSIFLEQRKYRGSFYAFFAPDILYILNTIVEFKSRRSSKYRIKQLITHMLEETWLKSTTSEHENILDFGELRRLKHTLFSHQIDTLKEYNTNVPKMQLKGFLLSTPAGCITGDSRLNLSRDGKSFTLSIEEAYRQFNQQDDDLGVWDLTIPTYIRSFTDNKIELHKIINVVYSGDQEVHRVHLEDGRSIDCTINHLIMTSASYVKAGDIVGQMVMCDTGYDVPFFIKAVSIEFIGVRPTFDVICAEPHQNFVGNGIVLHNSGKTIMSIALSVCLYADVTFFIVPKATVDTVWFDGIIDELGPTAKVWASTHDVELTPDYDYYIFHYEALEKALQFVPKLKARQKPFIAIDEAHNFNEITSQRTPMLLEVIKALKCENTVFATGTPVKALGREMIPLLRAVDPMFVPDVEERFKAIYGKTAKRANDILRNRLGLISYKIREDSYMSVARPIEMELKIKVPNEKRFYIETIREEMRAFMKQRYQYYQTNMKQYLKTYNDGINEYEKTITNSQERANLRQYKDDIKLIIEHYDPLVHGPITKRIKIFEKNVIAPRLKQPLRKAFLDATSIIKYVQLRVLGEALAIYARKRAECSSEMAKYGKLEDIVTNADKKTIIFSSFIPALKVADVHFKELGFNTMNIYGEYTKDLTAYVNEFKRDPDINPLMATLQSLAASQTLTVANVVIFLEAPFREYIRDQAFHRIFRIGQNVQTYTYLAVLDTSSIPNVSTRSQDILSWSQEQVSAIFGNLDTTERDSIVRRLHLNPTGIEQLMGVLHKVTGIVFRK